MCPKGVTLAQPSPVHSALYCVHNFRGFHLRNSTSLHFSKTGSVADIEERYPEKEFCALYVTCSPMCLTSFSL